MKRGLIVVAVAALVAVPVAYALLAERAVFNSTRNERNPAADDDGAGTQVWAFTRSRIGFPNRYDAFAKEGTNAPIKLNTRGQGWTGGIDYPTVVYQRVVSGQSDIKLYDLSNDTRPRTPTGVNTQKWEWHPSISGVWLLFGRDDNNSPTQRVVLHKRSTHRERIIARTTSANVVLYPGQVNGNWAVYTRCGNWCNVFKYDIATRTTTKARPPDTTTPRHQYGAGVTDEGVVYLGRSGKGCAANVKIVRYDPVRDPVRGRVVADLASGKDFLFGYARENPDLSVDFFYDRVTCNTGRWDVYRVHDPPPGP